MYVRKVSVLGPGSALNIGKAALHMLIYDLVWGPYRATPVDPAQAPWPSLTSARPLVPAP